MELKAPRDVVPLTVLSLLLALALLGLRAPLPAPSTVAATTGQRHVRFSQTAPPLPAGQLQVNSFPSSSQVPPCRQGLESQGREGFFVVEGWRVGFRRVVAGRVEVGLLVLTAPAVLVLGRPAVSGRRMWPVVAAAAVVYLRVVAGAMVVAVVVVTVVVKSLGIQSET